MKSNFLASLINQFIEARKDFIHSLQKFPKEKRDAQLFGEWNLKQVISHFSAWDKYFTNSLRDLKKGKQIEHWGSIDKYNELEVGKRKKFSWEKIYQEFIESGEEFIE